jgi:DNA-binding transcriptional ArsR family regulator
MSDINQTILTAELFKVLSDPTRLRIVQALLIEELCVCDISALINISISAISHQLRLLRSMKIVKNRKQGKMVYYSLTDEHIRKLINIADEHIHEER